jgi:hypothetical protein
MKRGSNLRRALGKIVLGQAVVLGILLVAQTARAQVGLDGVLSGMASGIEQRAQQVAVLTIKNKLVDDLCGQKTFSVGPKGQTTQLNIGCPDKGNACTADSPTIYFQSSCQLLEQPTVNLSDPTLLKTLSQELVEFFFRLSMKGMSQADYERLKLREFSDFGYQAMVQIVNKGDAHNLAIPLGNLADQIDSNYLSGYLTSISGLPITKTLITDLQAVGSTAPTNTISNDFFPSSTIASPKFAKALNTPVSSAGIPATVQAQCVREKLDVSLVSPLLKIQTAAVTNTLTATNTAQTVRNIYYAIADIPMLQNDLLLINTSASKQASQAMGDWSNTIISPMANGDFAPHELANFLRIVSYALIADQVDHDNLTKWFNSLTGEMSSALSDSSGDPVGELLHGSALGTNAKNSLSVYVRPLRDSVKEVLAMPRVQLLRAQIGPGGEQQTLAAFEKLVLSIRQLIQNPSGSVESTVGELAAIMNSFSQLASISPTGPAGADGKPVTSTNMAVTVFSSATTLLQDIADQNWVQIATDAAGDLGASTNSDSFDGKVVTFLKTLMEMYQAKSAQDAENIFLASMEDINSRQSRFDNLTVDITSLLGLRAGGEYSSKNWASLEGLYMPIGIQFAARPFGLMVYPLDLGTYLAVSSGSASPDTQASDALRFGGDLYWRIDKTVPIDLGIGGDIKPANSSNPEVDRAFFHLSAELPVFALN